MNNGHPNGVIQLVEIVNWKHLVATVAKIFASESFFLL